MKIKKAIVLFLAGAPIFAQLGISKGESADFTPHPQASLHILGDSSEESKSLGFILPGVNSKNELPITEIGGTNGNEEDPHMEGMVLYGNKNRSVNVYTGEIWEDDKTRFIDPTLKQSRFISAGNGDDQQSIVCVLLVCGRDAVLKFSHDIDGENSYNNLNITRENTTIRYGAINYTDDNSKFVIQEAGTYQIRLNIPTYIAGVVSLTEGASYQIYAFKQDEFGNHREILLSSVVPNFPGILGIGGGNKVGVGIATTIALNPGDYIYSMIHSPNVTVAVGSELRAWDNSLYNPREIIFTKID